MQHRYGGELSEVKSDEAFSNWPHLLFQYLENNIIWTKAHVVGDRSASKSELERIPDENPTHISCNFVFSY